MQMSIEERLSELGLVLPVPSTQVGNVVPCVVDNGVAYLSGQGAMWNGELRFSGRVGEGVTVEDGKRAAQLCALNLLAQLKKACAGDLHRIARVIKVSGFVRVGPDFEEVAQIVNGASDLFTQLLGDKGKHARSAVGVSNLPRGSAVVVEAVIGLEA